MDDGVSVKDPRTGLNQTGVQKRFELSGAERRWFEEFWKDGSNTIKFQFANPKKKDTQTWHRYEKYKKSRTVADMIRAGGAKADLIFAFCRGQVVIGKHTSIDVVRSNPLLKAMLVSSPAQEAARTISEAMETGTVMDDVLVAKVNCVSSGESDPSNGITVSMEYAEGVNWNNPSEEKIKVYNNTDWDFQVNDSGERMVIDERSAEGDAPSEEGCCLLTELIEKL